MEKYVNNPKQGFYKRLPSRKLHVTQNISNKNMQDVHITQKQFQVTLV